MTASAASSVSHARRSNAAQVERDGVRAQRLLARHVVEVLEIGEDELAHGAEDRLAVAQPDEVRLGDRADAARRAGRPRSRGRRRRTARMSTRQGRCPDAAQRGGREHRPVEALGLSVAQDAPRASGRTGRRCTATRRGTPGCAAGPFRRSSDRALAARPAGPGPASAPRRAPHAPCAATAAGTGCACALLAAGACELVARGAVAAVLVVVLLVVVAGQAGVAAGHLPDVRLVAVGAGGVGVAALGVQAGERVVAGLAVVDRLDLLLLGVAGVAARRPSSGPWRRACGTRRSRTGAGSRRRGSGCRASSRACP